MLQAQASPPTSSDLEEALSAFQYESGLKSADHILKTRPDGTYLIFYLGLPTDRFFEALQRTSDRLPATNQLKERLVLKQRPKAPKERLALPEARLLRTVLSESLTVSRHSFELDFFSRYIRSVFGAEDQIIAKGNHIVFGRRGAGKSSLLAYYLHQLKVENRPHAWVACQAYQGQSELQVIPNILLDILKELRRFAPNTAAFDQLLSATEMLISREEALLSQEEILLSLDDLIPRIRRLVADLVEEKGQAILFLDDVHVLGQELQPKLLAKLYSISRGNRTHLKLSGIEQFTRTWDPVKREGLQYTHDVQIIRLDYNLTMPRKSMTHIESILDAHAHYCGLPSIRHLCRGKVIDRLVLAAAAVPRDALNLFAQAMSRSIVKDDRQVTITSINAAVSEMAEEKLRDIQRDASAETAELRQALDTVVSFCITEIKQNAFLVEIQNDNPLYQLFEKLIALRLLHVLHEGITPDQASRRFTALMLDFGFYVGIRAAKSVSLFQKEPAPLQAKQLRQLPKFPLRDKRLEGLSSKD